MGSLKLQKLCCEAQNYVPWQLFFMYEQKFFNWEPEPVPISARTSVL